MTEGKREGQEGEQGYRGLGEVLGAPVPFSGKALSQALTTRIQHERAEVLQRRSSTPGRLLDLVKLKKDDGAFTPLIFLRRSVERQEAGSVSSVSSARSSRSSRCTRPALAK